MYKYTFRRILQAIPTLLIIATGTFLLLQIIPGGPFDSEKTVSSEVQAYIEAQYALDKPLWEQYILFLKQRLSFDFGPSYSYVGWDVDEIIAQSFPISLELGFYGLIIALAIGIPIGVIAALQHKRKTETFLMAGATFGICLPTFVLAPLLILVFGLWLNWFNTFGWNYASDKVLPSLTLGLFYAAYIARLTRTGMLDVLRMDFVKSARAKGLKERFVIARHTLRVGLFPVIAYLGPAVAGLITGSFVIETIFFIPGLGSYFVNSAFNRDHTMIMGTVLFYAVIIIVCNLIADLLQMWADPRLRHEQA